MSKKLDKQIYIPKDTSMLIAIFASGGGGNLNAAIRLSIQYPHLLKVGLVVADRLGIPAIEIAKKNNIPVIAQDFEKECGIWAECKKDPKKTHAYRTKAKVFHNRILEQIKHLEKKNHQPFDLIVLSYHRWIEGDLLEYFWERIINQHSGDLSVIEENQPLKRKYIGINPVLNALKASEKKTRTSTILVRNDLDTGEILCQGPWVEYKGEYPVTKERSWRHELIQKRESDWPSLQFALKNIALGNYAISQTDSHPDGNKVILFKKRPLPYGGIDIEQYKQYA